MNLDDWENRIRPYLSQVELLGEILLGRDEHAELEAALADFVKRHGLTEATRCMQNEYPATFVTYLAFKAAFNEERGFWEQVGRALGIQASLHSEKHHWGQIFAEIIARYSNLRQFKGVSGYQYVTPIRLHGGIPAFSLPDFFRHILLPSVEKAPYDGMSDEQALGELLARYTAELFVDDVVRHFFQHSGEHAQRFFGKCRNMARLVASGQPLPAPHEIGLRPYVLQAFETFRERETEPSARRRRPRIYFDPYTPGFIIRLPPQPLNLEQAGKRYLGRLYSPVDGEIYAEENRLRVRRQGIDWVIEEIEWLLEQPLGSVQVGLFAQGEETPITSYTLRILPSAGYPSLLAFNYPDGALRPISPALPDQSLWLLYPVDVELRFDGTARQVEALHPFPSPWDAWQAGAWDLGSVYQLRLLRGGEEICPPIPVSALLEPTLTPSSLPARVVPVDEKPLYTTPPNIRLPLRNVNDPSAELEGWRFCLESRHAALPAVQRQGTVSELSYQILPDESCALLSLAPLLGNTPSGTYHLSLSHRGRPTIELPFRVCPGLEIRGLQPYYLPAKDGAQTVRFQVILPPNSRLHAENQETQIEANWQVSIPAETAQADLRVEIPAQPESINLPLRVVIPRLRWALLLQPASAFEWQHQPISLPLAELLQADLSNSRPRLRVELAYFGLEKPLSALHLFVPEHEKALQTSDSCSLASHWAEFDLSSYFDTLRAYPEESVFEFRLELMDIERELNVFLPVLRLSRQLKIRACHFERRSDGRWQLHWHEPRPLRHRRLWLWSLWQPWADAAEIPLPDDAPPSDVVESEGWWMYDIPDEFGLPPSEYRAHFVAVAPYERNLPPRFPPTQAIEVSMIHAQERLRQIQKQLENASPGQAFALHFEKLCIYHTQNQYVQQQEEIRWCLEHWQQASLIHLDALQSWLGEYDTVENQRAFLLHMFRQEKLDELKRYSHPFIEKYLANLSNVYTLKPASAYLILEIARDPKSILIALKFLLQAQEESAHIYFWQALEQGRFSEADAAQTLARQPDLARQLLQNSLASPWRTRLLRELSRYADLPEWVVKIGYYILFDGGWGKILQIDGASRTDYFLVKEEQPTLTVELLHWPGQTVKIDLATRQITLQSNAYICSCKRFIVLGGRETIAIRQQHLIICESSTLLPIPAILRLTQTPLYRCGPPENPFDTRLP
jgi:hypothetical protein